MKILKKEIQCPVCGKKHIYKDIVSLYVNDTYLDGQPLGVDLTFGIDECPNCHYVTNNIEASISQETKKIVLSQKYKEDALKEKHDYFLLNSMYILHKKYIEQLFWYKRNHGMEYQNILNELIHKNEENFSKGNIDETSYISYIDLLRQSGRFEDCKMALESLLLETKNDFIKSVISYEKKLIDNQDKNSHLYSEIDNC